MKILKIIGIIWLVSTVLVVLLVAFGPKKGPSTPGTTSYTAASVAPTATPTPTMSVVFDNGTGSAARVKVDGKQIASVGAYQVGSTAEVPVGKHRIEILGAGNKTLDKRNIDVPVGLSYRSAVYNIAGANHYAVYTMGYGSAKVTTPRRALPDKYFFVKESGVGGLGDGFPSVVKVRKGTGGTTMSVLGHVPIHRGRKCCERLRASLKVS